MKCMLHKYIICFDLDMYFFIDSNISITVVAISKHMHLVKFYYFAITNCKYHNSLKSYCDVSRWERDLTDTRRIQLVIHRLNSATKLSIPGISRGNNNSLSVASVSRINSLYLTNYSSSLND